jgi:hypothetical protein
MSNLSIQIPNIVTYLKAIPNIASVLWERIFFWPPISFQDWIYLVINVVSQVWTSVDKVARVEFRFIWDSENTKKQSLIDIQDIVTELLVFSWENWIKKFWTFEVYSIQEWPVFQLFIDDKNRPLLIKDYFFRFSN